MEKDDVIKEAKALEMERITASHNRKCEISERISELRTIWHQHREWTII